MTGKVRRRRLEFKRVVLNVLYRPFRSVQNFDSLIWRRQYFVCQIERHFIQWTKLCDRGLLCRKQTHTDTFERLDQILMTALNQGTAFGRWISTL